MLGALLLLAQLSIAASAPDSVGIREPVTVTVHVSGSAGGTPHLLVPSFAPFTVVRSSSSSRVTAGSNYRAPWLNVDYQFVLSPPRPGTFTLPPFEARLGQRAARSSPLRIVVRPTTGGGRLPEIVARAKLDSSASVNFHAMALPETVYVGQQATYQVGVFLDDDIRLRMRRNPEFVPPEPRSMLAYELPSAYGLVPTRTIGRRRYEVHTFQRAFFPLAAGTYVIPRAQLVYSVPLSSSFFSREETRTLRADSVVVVALEPPADSRPADYAGAVGDLRVAAHLDSGAARVGDPMVLTVRVSGAGNVKLFPRPRVRLPWASVVPAEERVQLDTQATTVRGAKEFDWVVTPNVAGAVVLPAVSYTYFNPLTERYEIALTEEQPLTVAPGLLAAVDTGRALPPPLALRTHFRGSAPDPLTRRPGFWWLAMAAPVPALMLGAARRPRRRRRSISPHARLRAAARRGGDPWLTRKLYVQAVGRRIDLGPAAFATPGALTRALRREGVPPDVATAAESLLGELDRASYAVGAAPDPGLPGRALDMYERIERDARPRPTSLTRTTLALGAVASLALASSALATPDAGESPATLFARGIDAYRARHFAAAEGLFGAATRGSPDAPDAWANFGTAAWAAGDTAAAAVGWQRALRLEPRAADVRDRLLLLPASNESAIGWVPPVGATSVAAVALLLWLAAWSLAAWYAVRRRPPVGRWAMASGALAVLTIVAAQRVDELLAARRLVVVGESASLRALPALGAEQGAAVIAGELAAVSRRQGVWTRVRLDGERDGWIESDRLVSIARD